MARVLIIDDDPDTMAILQQALNSAGYEVILAADGREGMMRHRASPADLVITDMPIQDGMETIREMHLCFPEVAIIAVSGRPDSGTMMSIAQNLPAVRILGKPFAADELIAAAANALGRQSQAQ